MTTKLGGIGNRDGALGLGGGIRLGGVGAVGGGVSMGKSKKGSERAPVPVLGEREGDASVAEPTRELTELEKAFADRANNERDRAEEATDSEFWVAFCFETREQKEEFLTKLKLIDLGDKYVNGHDAAEVLGVELTEVGRARKLGRVDPTYAAMAMKLDD